MTVKLAMASLLTGFLSGVLGLAKPSEEVSVLIAEFLTTDASAELKGIEYKQHGTSITVGEHQLEALPYMEQAGVHPDGEVILGIRFEIQVNGKKDERLTFGVVGNGKTRDAAIRHAVDHWWNGFATPLIRALADQNTDFSQAPYVAVPGSTAIRGEPPSGWIGNFQEMHQKLLAAIKAVIGEEPGVKAIDLKVQVAPSGQVGGECRVNSQVSQEVLEELRKLVWPTTEKGYMFYQVYILKHRSEG